MMMVYPTEEGEYEVMEEIGRGASALVHRALCIPLNQIVAIKCLDLETIHCTLEDIRREAQLMSLIDHENVIRAYCSFVVDHYLWVVMPYMEGGSCMHIMKVSHPDGFEEQIIATILKEALKALSYLHQQGHIHRDVKAGNILIDANGGVKLGDFGVSACMFDGGDRTYSRNTFVGTPCWMAPEVMEQKQGYDFRADIWSFGITALELAHGHAPFQKYPLMKVLLMTIQNAPPSLDYERDKRFSKAFREMISLCLQKDPNKRPTAEKLLKHSFFKQAKSGQFLVQNILHGLTPLWEREKVLRENDAARLAQKETPYLEQEEASQIVYKRGVSSWSFDVESLMISNELDDSELTCDKEHDHPWPSVSRQNDDSSMSSQNSSSVQLENLSSTSLTGVARSSVEKDNSTDSKFFDKKKLIENVDTDTKCAQQRVSSIVPPLSVFRNQGRDRWSFEKREPKQVGRFGVFDGDLDLESPGWQEITRRREVIQKEREKQMGTDPLNENEGNQNQKATTKPCGLQPANTALLFVDKESKSSRESFEGIREYNAGDTKNTDSTLSMNDEEDFLGPNLKSIEMQENNLSSFAQNYNIEDDSQPPSISGSVSNENERIAALVPQLQALIHQTSQQHGCLSNMLRSILPNSSSHGSNLTTKSLQHGGADEQVIRLMQREQELMLEVSSIKRKMESLMEELETLKLKNHQLENEVNASNAN